MRIVAVSATLPNLVDIAEFLDANEAFSFDDSYRPVKLEKHVHACGYVSKNQYKFWKGLDRDVDNVIRRFSNNKQTLVFCHTKKETEELCSFLVGAHPDEPRNLRQLIQRGVAYHHAGLDIQDRKLVEQQFLDRKLRILCATSTLAVGVNLPAHLVVVKGTMSWRGSGSGYQEIDAPVSAWNKHMSACLI
jgi:ATP-dependent DNA helicase HFM1/MER3